jgi:hypothetical protein
MSAENHRQICKGYQLVVDSIEKGISETGLYYQLTALGDYDGIEHGWLYNYWHKNYPQNAEEQPTQHIEDCLSMQNINASALSWSKYVTFTKHTYGIIKKQNIL